MGVVSTSSSRLHSSLSITRRGRRDPAWKHTPMNCVMLGCFMRDISRHSLRYLVATLSTPPRSSVSRRTSWIILAAYTSPLIITCMSDQSTPPWLSTETVHSTHPTQLTQCSAALVSPLARSHRNQSPELAPHQTPPRSPTQTLPTHLSESGHESDQILTDGKTSFSADVQIICLCNNVRAPPTTFAFSFSH